MPDPTPPKQYPSDFFPGGNMAYLVGMSAYHFVPPLDSPINDCMGLEEVLKDKHGFITQTLFDADRQQVFDLIETIKSECKPDSRVIFYYAGHGIADGADDVNERPKGFLLAVDSERGKTETYIEMGIILDALVGLPCKHLLIILDCCYAGAIRYAQQTRGIGAAVPKTLYSEKFAYYVSNIAKQVITSAAVDQKAMDSLGSRGQLNANHRSPFAESLIRNLAEGDQNWTFGHIRPDGIITGSELGYSLAMEISDQLSKNNIPFAEQQTPSEFSIGDDTKGEFIFVDSQKAILQLQPNPKENPWKGLADYSIKDNQLFYGRQRVLDGWWEGKTYYKGLLQLVSLEENCHKIWVTGRSGSGKSSLVKAGLLARLEADVPGSVTIITPGNTPFATHSNLLEQLKANRGKVYLMVDQYEELVTVCSDPHEKESFENSLAGIASLPNAIVIVTVRSDLESRFAGSPLMDSGKGGALYRFVVPPFSREEISEVVTQPAIQQLLEFRGNLEAGSTNNQDQADERFVNRIIDETFANPDSLPLLSFALNRLFETKAPDSLLLLEKDYDAFGGISGILDSKLTEAYNTYDDDHKALFQQLIYRMISFDSGSMAKRRVYTSFTSASRTFDELEFSNAGDTTAINAIEQDLVKRRLLKTARENEAGNDGGNTTDDNVYFEPAHEALLRSSNLISGWQNEGGGAFQGRIILLNAVSAGAKNYYFYQGKDKKGSLWKDDPRLDQVKSIWDKKELYLNKIEETFINESLLARTRAKRILWTAVSVIFLVLIAASIYSYQQKIQANAQTRQAQNQLAQNYWTNSQTALANGDNLRSYLLLATAINTTADPSTLNTMLPEVNSFFPGQVLAGLINTGSTVKSVESSNNDRDLIVLSDSATSLWEIATQKRLIFVPGKPIFAHLDDKGTRLFIGTRGGLACWDVSSQKKVMDYAFKSDSILWLKKQQAFLFQQANYVMQDSIATLSSHMDIMLLSKNFKQLWSLNGINSCVSGDETRLAAIIPDSVNKKEFKVVRVWDIAGRSPKALFSLPPQSLTGMTIYQTYGYAHLDLSYSGRFLRVLGGQLFDITTGKRLKSYEMGGIHGDPSFQNMGVSPEYYLDDGRLLILDRNEYHLLESSGKEPSTGEFYDMPPSNIMYKDSGLIEHNSYMAMVNKITANTGTLFNFDKPAKHRPIYDPINDNFIFYSDKGQLSTARSNGDFFGLSFMNAGQVDYHNVGLTADGKHIFAAAGPVIYMYRRIAKPTVTVEKNIIGAFFSPDGKFEVSFNKDSLATMHNYNNGKYEQIWKPVALRALVDSVGLMFNDNGFDYNSDGSQMLFIRGDHFFLVDFKKATFKILDHRGGSYLRDFDKNSQAIFLIDAAHIWAYDFETQLFKVDFNIPHSYPENGERSAWSDGSDQNFICTGVLSPDTKNYRFGEIDLSNAGAKTKPPFLDIALLLTPWLGYHETPPGFVDYMPGHKVIFTFRNQVEVYDFLKKKSKVIATAQGQISWAAFNNNKKTMVAISDDNIAWVIDAVKQKLVNSFKLPNIGKNSDQSGVLINDAGTMMVQPSYDGYFLVIDLSNGKLLYQQQRSTLLFLNTESENAPNYTYAFADRKSAPGEGPDPIFDLKTTGYDADEPPSLFALEAAALTGSRLRPGNNELEGIPIDELVKIRKEYQIAAAAHYAQCKYKPFNLWKQAQGMAN